MALGEQLAAFAKVLVEAREAGTYAADMHPETHLGEAAEAWLMAHPDAWLVRFSETQCDAFRRAFGKAWVAFRVRQLKQTRLQQEMARACI